MLPPTPKPQANQILGLAPGEIFVQRNVGNQALHTDLKVMSCLEYAVKALKARWAGGGGGGGARGGHSLAPSAVGAPIKGCSCL